MIDCRTYSDLHPGSEDIRLSREGLRISKVEPAFIDQKDAPSEPDLYLFPRAVMGYDLRRKRWGTCPQSMQSIGNRLTRVQCRESRRRPHSRNSLEREGIRPAHRRAGNQRSHHERPWKPALITDTVWCERQQVQWLHHAYARSFRNGEDIHS